MIKKTKIKFLGIMLFVLIICIVKNFILLTISVKKFNARIGYD